MTTNRSCTRCRRDVLTLCVEVGAYQGDLHQVGARLCLPCVEAVIAGRATVRPAHPGE